MAKKAKDQWCTGCTKAFDKLVNKHIKHERDYKPLKIHLTYEQNLESNYKIKEGRQILNEVMDILILQGCVFFVFIYVYSITYRNNASISNFRGGFRWQSEYPLCIIESHFYEICQNHENLQVKKFNIKFFINFPSHSYRENSKHHKRKNFKCVFIFINIDIKFLAESKYLKITMELVPCHLEVPSNMIIDKFALYTKLVRL
ncbi:hypothetical protein AGLY_008705 [Aphis glycines]|uniref:Uncharacterized protein n=1 Tax=Aphis glycines TaxID=307491 RepID=A0A6G0TJI1_APHGL|nr:hypothetical protein AGLY_008705 [Aphis glycines]